MPMHTSADYGSGLYGGGLVCFIMFVMSHARVHDVCMYYICEW